MGGVCVCACIFVCLQERREREREDVWGVDCRLRGAAEKGRKCGSGIMCVSSDTGYMGTVWVCGEIIQR